MSAFVDGGIEPIGLGSFADTQQIAFARVNPLSDIDPSLSLPTPLADGPLPVTARVDASLSASIDAALECLNFTPRVSPENLARIPQTGPAILLCDRMAGPMEALLLAGMLIKVRPDFRFLAGESVRALTFLSDHTFSVQGNPLDDASAKFSHARKTYRKAIRFLREGGLLVVFPARSLPMFDTELGTVSEPAWRPTAARIAKRTSACIIPVLIPRLGNKLVELQNLAAADGSAKNGSARNGSTRNPSGRTAPAQNASGQNGSPKTAFPARGNTSPLRSRAGSIQIRVGRKFDANEPAPGTWQGQSITALNVQLRSRLRALLEVGRVSRNRHHAPAHQPMPRPADDAIINAERKALKSSRLLVNDGEYRVYLATYDEIPEIVQEIGRLREFTNRQIGCATGLSVDLDACDEHYLHLILWHHPTKRLVGGCRLGVVEQIVPSLGAEGLSASSHFSLEARVLKQLAQAVELGKFFVLPEYSQTSRGRVALWQALSRFVLRYPSHHEFFAAVQISNTYLTQWQQGWLEFLQLHDLLGSSADAASAAPLPASDDGLDVECNRPEFATLEAIRGDAAGIPALLWKFSQMGGRIIGYDANPAHPHLFDALVSFDLARADAKLLKMYLGDQARPFLLSHRRDPGTPLETADASAVAVDAELPLIDEQSLAIQPAIQPSAATDPSAGL